jgi:TonB family protein
LHRIESGADLVAQLAGGGPGGRYAPSRRDRGLIFVLILAAHAAALWFLFALRQGEVLRQRDAGGGSAMMVFDVAASDTAPRRRRTAGVADGGDAPPVPLGGASEAEVAKGDPEATDRENVSGASGALSRAIAEALADNPGAGGERLDYRIRLVEHIRRFLFYPPAAVERGLSGTVVVRFRLDRAGQVIDLRVVSTRGATLDAAAMTTIWKAEPMPPVPTAIETPWEVDVPIDFHASMRKRS